jgi:hypothetical protein
MRRPGPQKFSEEFRRVLEVSKAERRVGFDSFHWVDS